MSWAGRILNDLREMRTLPELSVNLMLAATRDNDPFYGRVVRDFHDTARKRHPKLAFVRTLEYGVAVCMLPATFDEYFMAIEAAGRRNCRKADRRGYRFERIAFNDYLEQVGEIRASTDVRQGKMPDDYVAGRVAPCTDPPSRSRVHDYPYYGILEGGKLRAYAGCLVAGEVCMIEHILGHADFMQDGIVPRLVVGIAREMIESYPCVKYYGYGTYYGCGTTMRRFKRKFRFVPHRVRWELGE